MKSSALTSHQSRIHWQFTQYARQVTAYSFDSAQHGADLFDLKVPGNIYLRIMNPTCAVLEQRVAALEGGIGALAVASGMSAISYAIQTIAEAGDNIVSLSELYGGTCNLFAHTFPRMGLTTRFAELSMDPVCSENLPCHPQSHDEESAE